MWLCSSPGAGGPEQLPGPTHLDVAVHGHHCTGDLMWSVSSSNRNVNPGATRRPDAAGPAGSFPPRPRALAGADSSRRPAAAKATSNTSMSWISSPVRSTRSESQVVAGEGVWKAPPSRRLRPLTHAMTPTHARQPTGFGACTPLLWPRPRRILGVRRLRIGRPSSSSPAVGLALIAPTPLSARPQPPSSACLSPRASQPGSPVATHSRS